MATSEPTGTPTAADAADLERVVDLLAGKRIAVLSGAGLSTDSGIPDYRGAGRVVRKPMTFQEFRADPAKRQRYWAGSHLGWRTFAAARPNDGHRALATLEDAGLVTGVITQNVDGLHLRAGSRRVVEIHGSMDRAVCLTCGQVFSRADLATVLDRDNAWLDEPGSVQLQPDGDVEITDVSRFLVPDCTVCGGVLKPDVVFFGEFVPAEKFREAVSIVAEADALLVVGSSLTVNSGVRLVDHAARRKHPVVIVNRGSTRSDRRAAVKIDAGTTETLEALAAGLLARGVPAAAGTEGAAVTGGATGAGRADGAADAAASGTTDASGMIDA
ncbi:Sir2 family NAD-dependent protein deacetylase [Curtobacterium sp. ISL-83]|uniref:Sir2 family NAD-dependent protein deacetylase n=1 Tax=Curtobacterium sp. ISL-83 TaxID=2819145 RepID=UPI001BE95716|nr:Sir2 family NAD-dependent protein deacetylase [Curtobacterium sp. ISL-83]MBT2503189.1 NAD-dependent deacetylase [Curtobacterium sp. ISL-83]